MTHFLVGGGDFVCSHGLQEDASGLKKVAKNMEFTFDRIFMQEATQATVFQEISQLAQSSCDGYNVCIFAYGQTGSGKVGSHSRASDHGRLSPWRGRLQIPPPLWNPQWNTWA